MNTTTWNRKKYLPLRLGRDHAVWYRNDHAWARRQTCESSYHVWRYVQPHVAAFAVIVDSHHDPLACPETPPQAATDIQTTLWANNPFLLQILLLLAAAVALLVSYIWPGWVPTVITGPECQTTISANFECTLWENGTYIKTGLLGATQTYQ